MYREASKHLKDLKSMKIPVHFPNGNHSIVLSTPTTYTHFLPPYPLHPLSSHSPTAQAGLELTL